jgi:LysM repeat protein
MKFRNILIACVCVSLAGCSIFDGADTKKKDANVAYFISPEISSQGASARKKPMQPKQAVASVARENIGDANEKSVVPAGKISTYTACKGDTIYGVARKFGMSPSYLMEMNGLNRESKLIVGQTLKICGDPVEKIANSVPPAPTQSMDKKMTVYTVQAGDTLSRIAVKHGISLRELREANGFPSDQLKIGQKLNIPSPTTVAGKSNISQSPSPMQLDVDGKYVVRQGDSLYVIAKRFDVKQADLRDANGIENPDQLKIGQRLTIPTKSTMPMGQEGQQKIQGGVPPAPKRTSSRAMGDPTDLYTIKSGDSVAKIADELGVNESDLLEMNNLEASSRLQVGKKLLVPQKRTVTEKKPDHTAAQRSGDFFDNFEEIPVVEVKN